MDNQEMFQEFEEASRVQADQLTLAQLDKLLAELKQVRDEYDEKKAAATEAYKKCEALENTVIDTLTALNRKSYEAEGVCKVTKVSKLVYRVPSNPEQKKKLFDYIKARYGDDTLLGMVGINHQTLNSWANKERDDVVFIPGLEDPTSVDSLQVRKA